MYGGCENLPNAFVDLEAALEIVVRSKKPKAAEFTKWLTRKGIDKLVDEDQIAIEEKGTHLALLDNDLIDTQQSVTILEQDNFQLHAEVERFIS